jgi:hypothetical protein
MFRIVLFAVAAILATSCVAADKLSVIQKSGHDAIAKSHCTRISAHEVFSLPPDFRRRNVCFPGVLYVDSEATVVFPADPSEKPVFWDVTVSLVPLAEPSHGLSLTDGARVWLIGDLVYDRDCWAGSLKAEEQRVCAPARRPIYLSNGLLVLSEE